MKEIAREEQLGDHHEQQVARRQRRVLPCLDAEWNRHHARSNHHPIKAAHRARHIRPFDEDRGQANAGNAEGEGEVGEKGSMGVREGEGNYFSFSPCVSFSISSRIC